MLAENRYKEIMKLLEKDNSVKASYLMKKFQVSFETVRRDLEYMEKCGFLRRVYGGAVLSKMESRVQNFSDREKEYINEKKQIAKIAVKYVKEGQSIALDYGTTTMEVARELKNNFENLTIITNSMIIASELSVMPKYTIIVTGGILNSNEFALVGSITSDLINRLHVNKAFISVGGVSVKKGLTDCFLQGIESQKNFISIADETIVVCTSEKFDCVSLTKICDIDRVNLIITDSGLQESVYDKYTQAGINVVYK